MNKHKEKSVYLGFEAETQARHFLEKHGLVFESRNYNVPFGEIDLIMRDGEVLVFVEVRMRKDSRYGAGIDSISPSKISKLKKAALSYLQGHHLLDKIPARFDVVGIGSFGQVTWIKNAIMTD